MNLTRSYLFVPGDRPERFGKAWASAADEIIIDLEDAVGLDHKHQARAAVAGWLSAARPVVVRVNAADTPWYQDDLALLQHPGVRALMLPKAETLEPGLVQSCLAHGKRLLPLIETARGFQQAAALASTAAVERLGFGAIDFQVDTGIEGDDDALLYFRSRLVLESRLAGIGAPIDGVSTAIHDAATLRSDTERSRRLGFGGKLCIHPAQVDVVNTLFSPSEQELEWARQVVQASEQSAGAAVAVAGKMVDRPVLLKAQRILKSQQRIARPALPA